MYTLHFSSKQNVLIAISAEGDCYIFDFTDVSKVSCVRVSARI